MIGKSLSVVTLEQRRMALSSNFLKVEMRETRPPNQMIELEIGGITASGLQERTLLPVL
jgi:hypothetical protein